MKTTAERKRILDSYPAMLGYFLAAHSIANERYSWFGMQERHLPIMQAGARQLIDACRQTGCMIDLTGIHPKNETAAHKRKKDGFLFGFQRRFIENCMSQGVPAYPGSDAHALTAVGSSRIYGDIFSFNEN